MKLAITITCSLITVLATAAALPASGEISYGALGKDLPPCSEKTGASANCRPGAPANSYNRGCSEIDKCRGAAGTQN